MPRRTPTPHSPPFPSLTEGRSDKPDPTPILLEEKRNAEGIRVILSAYGLRDLDQADRNLDAMAGDPIQRRQLADILPMLMESIARTADPDQALNHWERMLESVSRTSFLDYLRTSPRMLDLLCVIFGNSDALTFTLIRDPTVVYWLAEEDVLARPPTRKGMERALYASIGHLTSKESKLDALRRFQRREMLRIGVRDLLRLSTVPETTSSLSDLACLLIHAAYEVVDADLRQQYGIPMHQNRQRRWVETKFTVIGMGKLGGHELNYSSDVDLIYLYESHDGETRAPRGRRAVSQPASAFPMKNILRFLPASSPGCWSNPPGKGTFFGSIFGCGPRVLSASWLARWRSIGNIMRHADRFGSGWRC